MKRTQPSQRELILKSNKVNNNPYSVATRTRDMSGMTAADMEREKEKTLYDSKLNKVIEAFRKMRREDADDLNRIVSKREPTEPSKTEYLRADPEKFNKAMTHWKSQAKKSSAQFRLKNKGKVPQKAGKPMWEEYGILEEDFNKFISAFRKYYTNGKTMTFRNWLEVMDALIDTL
jgi:hypothetical protein